MESTGTTEQTIDHAAKAKEITDKIFEKFDEDNNKAIDKEECKAIFIQVMKEMHATNLAVKDEQIAAVFDAADTNKDGVISYDEALAFVTNNMEKLQGLGKALK